MNRVSQALNQGGSWGRFWWHYLQMVIAMMVGMALTPVARMLFETAGAGAVFERADVYTMTMATTMVIGMSAWMLFRGHGQRPILEMAAAMYLPFLALLPFLYAGLLSRGGLSMIGHVMMFLAMIGVMLLRPTEYMLPHHRHAEHAHPVPARD